MKEKCIGIILRKQNPKKFPKLDFGLEVRAELISTEEEWPVIRRKQKRDFRFANNTYFLTTKSIK